MENELFRKKSLDKIKSPDQLNDYLRVVNPGVWLLLAAVVILLVGAIIWGTTAKLETGITASAVCENGVAVCYVQAGDVSAISEGMTVRIGSVEGKVVSVGSMDLSTALCPVSVSISIPDGSYSASIITESISPMSFLMN